MREIKFRAWNKLKKIMVYEDEDNSSQYLDGWCASDVQVLNQTLNSEFSLDIYEFMQYTGLKDRNNKEIYEGDIINIQYYETLVENAVVEYIGASFYGSTIADTWELDGYVDIEVIGNIYDNPGLKE